MSHWTYVYGKDDALIRLPPREEDDSGTVENRGEATVQIPGPPENVKKEQSTLDYDSDDDTEIIDVEPITPSEFIHMVEKMSIAPSAQEPQPSCSSATTGLKQRRNTNSSSDSSDGSFEIVTYSMAEATVDKSETTSAAVSQDAQTTSDKSSSESSSTEDSDDDASVVKSETTSAAVSQNAQTPAEKSSSENSSTEDSDEDTTVVKSETTSAAVSKNAQTPSEKSSSENSSTDDSDEDATSGDTSDEYVSGEGAVGSSSSNSSSSSESPESIFNAAMAQTRLFLEDYRARFPDQFDVEPIYLPASIAPPKPTVRPTPIAAPAPKASPAPKAHPAPKAPPAPIAPPAPKAAPAPKGPPAPIAPPARLPTQNRQTIDLCVEQMLLVPELKTGVMSYFNHYLGYGFIVGDDGIEYFCHKTALRMNRFERVAIGERVMFTTRKRETKPRDSAIDVCGSNRALETVHVRERLFRCYNCGEYSDHMADACPKPQQPKRCCYHCKSNQHFKVDCPYLNGYTSEMLLPVSSAHTESVPRVLNLRRADANDQHQPDPGIFNLPP